MSFSLGFTARSRSHALALLEQRRSSVPAPVHAFLETAIKNVGPQSGTELGAIEVSATGHLAESSSDYSISSGTLSVKPVHAPD